MSSAARSAAYRVFDADDVPIDLLPPGSTATCSTSVPARDGVFPLGADALEGARRRILLLTADSRAPTRRRGRRPMTRMALTAVIVALAITVSAAVARAQVDCSDPDQLCTGDPCVISSL